MLDLAALPRTWYKVGDSGRHGNPATWCCNTSSWHGRLLILTTKGSFEQNFPNNCFSEHGDVKRRWQEADEGRGRQHEEAKCRRPEGLCNTPKKKEKKGFVLVWEKNTMYESSILKERIWEMKLNATICPAHTARIKRNQFLLQVWQTPS